jgi:hypothetical protein
MRLRWLILLFATGCAARNSPPPADPMPETLPPAPAPQIEQEPVPPRDTTPYPLDEAVKDALSSGWTHVGTGPWHGNLRAQACVYRNDRVVIVNVFCTLKETRAFEVQVFSPTRGRVRIYAEGKRPISTLSRRDYFSFNGESEAPPSGRQIGLPPVALTMSFPELRDYNEKRYNQFLPACFGGVEIHRRQGGCVRGLEPQASAWAARNGAFLKQPPDDWYRLVNELRTYAGLHGKPME